VDNPSSSSTCSGAYCSQVLAWVCRAHRLGLAERQFRESFDAIASDPWGIVSLADLYLGFFIFAAFVFLVDGVRPASFAWVIALMVLGNVLAVLWLVVRWPVLTDACPARLPEFTAWLPADGECASCDSTGYTVPTAY
jgi:hypothetical protein